MKFQLDNILDWGLTLETRRRYIDAFMTERGFKLVGEGRHRRTFRSPNGRYVIKFPIHDDGLEANQREHKLYRKYMKRKHPDGVVYAPCRLINDSILMMWSVQYVYGYSDGCKVADENGNLTRIAKDDAWPGWAEQIDCQQVGLLKNGKVAAYDYG